MILVNSNNPAGRALRDHLVPDEPAFKRLIVPYSGIAEEDLPRGYFCGNHYSPRFMIGVLRTLHDDPERYGYLVDWLKQARPKEYFSRYRGELEVAHKYGDDGPTVNDCGIIYAQRPFLLCVMCYQVPGARFLVGEIARIAMDYAEYLADQDAATPMPEPGSAPIPVPEAEPPAPEPALPPQGADGFCEIGDADALRGIALAPEGSYRLTADIDLSGTDWTPIPFYGTLDGAGHTIYNLTLRTVGTEIAECRDGNNLPYDAHYAGLFSVAKNAAVRDLQLRGVLAEVESEDNCFVAALAGYAFDLTAENVSVEGRLHLYAHGKIVGVGGMVGFGSGWFTDCRSDVELVFEEGSRLEIIGVDAFRYNSTVEEIVLPSKVSVFTVVPTPPPELAVRFSV